MKHVKEKKIYQKEKGRDIARRVEIEVGDEKQPNLFYPQFKTKHWDNECNLSIRLVDEDYANGQTRVVGEKVEWERAGRIARMYEKQTEDEDGAFEFEVELAEKPVSNVLSFSVQSKEFDFFYQPELTEQEIADGMIRPENVIGSYAVYHKTKKHNRTGGKHYRTGKAFHIYRPWAEDADGNRVWCDLNINEGLMTVTIPQDFLDTAVYPVVVDPTFGYTTSGSSINQIANQSVPLAQRTGSTYTLSENGTLDSIHAALTSTDDTDITVFLNTEDSGGSGIHGEIIQLEIIDTDFPTQTFEEFIANNENLVAGEIILSALGNPEKLTSGSCGLRFDTGGASRNLYVEQYAGAGGYATAKAEDPWTETASSTTNQYSIYATYTASASAPTIQGITTIQGISSITF